MTLPVVLSALVAAAGAAPAPEPCYAEIYSLSRPAAAPGQEFSIYGRFGAAQAGQEPRINRSGTHKLEVVSWGDTNVRVRVPGGLRPGDYVVGVSCGKGNPYSSGYSKFVVLPVGEAAPEETPEPAELHPPKENEGKPDGPWREEFEKKWQTAGRRVAERNPWWKPLKIAVIGDQGVEGDVLREIAGSLRSQLEELGSTRISVDIENVEPDALTSCARDGVATEDCVGRGVAKLRETQEDCARGVVAFVTNAAIGQLPVKNPDGSTSSGPAGVGSSSGGWILVSEYFRLKHKGEDDEFGRHGRDHTARHELAHLLGLPHHEQVPNPGYREALPCTACTHKGAGWHKPPHTECLMSCGSSDDDWFHARTFGKGFGLCDKCAAAGRAVVAGIEGRSAD